MLGAPAQQIPPLRSVLPTDFSLKNQRKYLCEWRFLMGELEQLAREHCADQWAACVQDCAVRQVDAVYEQVVRHLDRLPDESLMKYQRRVATHRVLTVSRDLRQLRKRRVEPLAEARGRRLRPRS